MLSHSIYISRYTNKMVFEEYTNNTKVRLTLKPEEYEHIIPVDYILGNKDLSTCEELWDLFDEYQDEHIIERMRA